MISKADIEKANAAIRPYIVCTPTVYSQKLSDLCGCRTLFKLENFQMTGSFKERGALNKLLRLTPEERSRGVVTASAGNHAQAVAYHCRRLGIRAKIVMRGLKVEGRITQLTVRLNDRPGSLTGVLEIIKRLQVNILDIIHHRLDSTAPFGYVDVSLTLETKGHDHIQEIRQGLKEGGYPV